MNAVLISIQPKWCELIASGKKTVEVRKNKPKLATPFKVYIYCTKDKNHSFCTDDGEQYTHIGNGKVIGEFVCDDITRIINKVGGFILEGRSAFEINTIARASCLDYSDMVHYFGATNNGYAWHISDLVIYDKPKELSEYWHECNGVCVETKKKIKCERIMVDGFSCNGLLPITRPPQSWCYAVKGD